MGNSQVLIPTEDIAHAILVLRGRRYLPNVFTAHGAIQAANVLNSPRAVEMGIYAKRRGIGFTASIEEKP
jgi:hypothetical protein